MKEATPLWEWDSVSAQPRAPQWAKPLLLVVGLPLVLFLTYLALKPALDDPELLIVPGAILLFMVVMILSSGKQPGVDEQRLVIRIDAESLHVTFDNETRRIALARLDRERLRISPGLNGYLEIAELGSSEVNRYPLLVMSAQSQREMHRALSGVRDAAGNSA